MIKATRIIWVQSNINISGNENADKLAKQLDYSRLRK